MSKEEETATTPSNIDKDVDNNDIVRSSSPLDDYEEEVDDDLTNNNNRTRQDFSKMSTPYYSYHVDKTIQSNDSAYWARRSKTMMTTTSEHSLEPNSTSSASHATTVSGSLVEDRDGVGVEVDNGKFNDTAEVAEKQIKEELNNLYTDFHKCLELRDKYMKFSLQRLGDNPKDHEDYKIYPSPPAPSSAADYYAKHSNLNKKKAVKIVGEDFHVEECEIPGDHQYVYELSTDGVYYVYKSEEDLRNHKIKNHKDKKYFMDLDFILNVISDGPTKTYAYRRLRYLESKWNMYTLLKEYQEMAESKDEVIFRDNKVLTLIEVFKSLGLTAYDLSYFRFGVKSKSEWSKLAKWVVHNKIFSPNVRWLIQMPRLYSIYKSTKTVENFEDVIKNLYEPLYEVTKNPKKNPELHIFLQRVIGFDSVDDESKAERRIHKKYPVPKKWDTDLNPPYSYYLYYMYANMISLNQWRKERGFNTFVLRPHAGEAGDTDHLTSAFLTSHSISHGILLRKVPALQYLYYLKQIGIAMSPLSNNALFLTYERNPFMSFFQKGLNVSLSTDDPLQFHYTKEPLIEEYSVAAQIWKLSACDMCELARNSVLQSGFEMMLKKHWLGSKWFLPGPDGNDIHRTNTPNVRISFRHETLMEEINMLAKYSRLKSRDSFVCNTIEMSLSNYDKYLSSTQSLSASATSQQSTPEKNVVGKDGDIGKGDIKESDDYFNSGLGAGEQIVASPGKSLFSDSEMGVIPGVAMFVERIHQIGKKYRKDKTDNGTGNSN
ncbi:17039_t:CDS:10 [Entrophospora sp. SA101]|nr:17039_t:CDS:10 [Entrophospora sp. SA101]CAJ0836351.1 10936_t:CDS:10 [Entrophospora sp. SA101]CAJ0838269.1 3549_t:CDS:10 [Entrophospora sp. SA101]